MSDIQVIYNNYTFSPTPLVSQEVKFLDYGSRWGNRQEISLIGYYTGINTGAKAVVTGFAQIFTGQFGHLQVLEGSTVIYDWNYVVIEEIDFANNHFFQTSMAPYSVKMHVYNVPSGIIDPINTYNFNQDSDGVVTVAHKISAHGVKQNNGGLNNAISFVQSFTGQNPFGNLAPAFIPGGSGILSSFNEVINRDTCGYEVNEIYKYNTGRIQPYVDSFNAIINDDFNNEWLTIDANWKIQGSPVNNNITSLDPYISNSYFKLNDLNISTGNLIVSTSSYERNTGAATIDIKISYISGYFPTDISGYFDYVVSFQNDDILPQETWKIDGDFVCYGPLQYKKQQLNGFKTINGGNWTKYLTGLIISSPIYSYHNAANTFGAASTLNIHENTGLAILHLSLTTHEGALPAPGITSPKYDVNVQPAKWLYQLLPSSNIEGQYIVQDLQISSKSKIQASMSADTITPSASSNTVSGLLINLGKIYETNFFITDETIASGVTDVSASINLIGDDNISVGNLSSKVAGSILTNYTRPPGYLFGF